MPYSKWADDFRLCSGSAYLNVKGNCQTMKKQMPVVCGVRSCLAVTIALLMPTIADGNDAARSGFRLRPTPAPRPTPPVFPPRATCPQYVITAGTPTIVPGISDTGNHCVWCETVIPLPFPFVLYRSDLYYCERHLQWSARFSVHERTRRLHGNLSARAPQ